MPGSGWGGGGGVSAITAGDNITISPIGGTGNVTINSDPGVSAIIAGDNITISPIGGTGAVTVNAVPAVPSGATGSIQFADSGAFASDNSNLFWDDSNNRLGIGTNSPNESIQILSSGASKLHIETTTLDTNVALGFEGPSAEWQLGTNRVGLAGDNANFYLRHSNSSTNVIVFEPGGNVGIGINDPGEMLHVMGNIRATGSLTIGAGASFFLDGGSNTFLNEASADVIGFTTGGTSRMTLSTSQLSASVNINAEAGKVFQQSGNSGIGSNGTVYTFGGGVDGDIATLTVAGGIVTGKTDASDPTPSTLQGFHGEFVIQHSSGGNIDFRANGAGTNVNEKTLFSGGIINTIGDVEEGYYTIGDIVKALKENGTLEAFGGDTWQPT